MLGVAARLARTKPRSSSRLSGERLKHAASAALPKRAALGAPDHQVCDRPPPTDICVPDVLCTGEGTENRMSSTDASRGDDGQPMDAEETSVVTDTEQPPPILRWKRGAELPVLVAENLAAVS